MEIVYTRRREVMKRTAGKSLLLSSRPILGSSTTAKRVVGRK